MTLARVSDRFNEAGGGTRRAEQQKHEIHGLGVQSGEVEALVDPLAHLRSRTASFPASG